MQFDILKGKTIVEVDGAFDQSEELIFTTSDGSKYKQYHYQDCCEWVRIEELIGDIDDILNSPILLAEEVSNNEENPAGYESHTWTFYKLSTIKGSVTIRWLGTSNGYYSEKVYFEQIS